MRRLLLLLVVIACAAIAVWQLRQPETPEWVTAEGPGAAEATPQEGAEPPVAAGGPAARAPAREPTAARDPAAAEATAVGNLPDALRPWRQSDDPLARPGVLRVAAGRAWDAHMAPLFNPPGHPQAGKLRQELSLDQVLGATSAYLDEVHAQDRGSGVPLLQVERRLTLKDARDLTPGLDWRLRDDRVRIYEILRDTDYENPDAPLRAFTFLAPEGGHPEAITRAEFERERTLEAVRERFAREVDGG